MTLLLALDIGTGSVRAALLTPAGETVAIAAREHDQIVPQFGWAEQRPKAWWDGTVAAIRTVLAQVPGAADRIAAIAGCGQMHATVLLDADGRPTLDAVPLWNDKRARAEVAALAGASELAALAANPPSVAWPGFKLAWLRTNRPEAWERATLVLGAKDWINFRLTGAVATDAPEASCTWLADAGGQWNPLLLAALGIDAGLLPPIREPADVLGTVGAEAARETGLRVGTPVAVGVSDYPAALLGTGVIAPGTGSDVTGTSTLITLMTERPVADPVITNARGVVPARGNGDAGGGWCAFTILDAGGDAMRWARRALASGMEYAAIVELAATAPAGSDGLLFLPYLNGERMGPRANSRAQFVGLTSGHGAAHLHRAVMEGVAFAAARNLRLMTAQGHRLDRLVAAGGGARTRLWLEIKASIYDCPVVTTAAEESGLLACAMIAGTAVGLFASLPRAAAALVQETGEIMPNPAWRDRYARLGEVFDAAYEAGGRLWGMLDRASDNATGMKIAPLTDTPETRLGLRDLLIETVAHGGSVSFMHPLAPAAADAFWSGALAAAGRGERVILGAWDGGVLAGTVTLLLDCPPNQPHRAEIAKMMTRTSHRRRGIATSLLHGAERIATERGRTLLVLDTASDGGASGLYEALGFTFAGEVPDYALKPKGGLSGTRIYYKRI